MFVYFIRSVEGGPIKIGRASAPSIRLQQLQAMSPVKLEIIGLYKGGSLEENHLHRKFAEYRQHGEWFEPCEELLELIANLPKEENFSIVNGKTPVLEMYLAGFSMNEIGSVFNVTRQRIHQILSDYDYKNLERQERKENVTAQDFYNELIEVSK